MAELNLKQITDKLNAEFDGEDRKLVFWYDDKGEFADEIGDIRLENAKIYQMKQSNQFYTKYFLEKIDTETSYLIYAPFSKPPVPENHLEDILLYSKRFYADRASLLCVDLGIEEKYKPVIQKHIKYFSEKSRIQRFYVLEINRYDEKSIQIGIMSAICRIKISSFEEIVRVLLMDGSLEDNPYMKDLKKYDLLDSFWKYCEQQFGFVSPNPTLEKLLITMFVTYASRNISAELPQDWRDFVSYKPGNIIAFMDNVMNNVLYRKKYDVLSSHVADILDAAGNLRRVGVEYLVECDSFEVIDVLIIRWLRERLFAEDLLARLNGYDILELCEIRSKMHFGEKYGVVYWMLRSAYRIIAQAGYVPPKGFRKIAEQYQERDYLTDACYREFYLNYDAVGAQEDFHELRGLVENIYTNEYLGRLLPAWNEGLQEKNALSVLSLQRDFFNRFVKGNKERIVVIISDGMRYEVGRQLYDRLCDEPKSKVSIQSVLGILPSYTRLGMEALLPHKKLELSDDFKELADGRYAVDLAARQQLLKEYEPDSCCVRYDDIKGYTGKELREVFTGKRVVYVYHDVIDNAGENDECEVFRACGRAVEEIETFITKAAKGGNTYRFIITGDHGFIYKRSPVTESDKIDISEEPGKLKKRRYMISKEPVIDDGICNMELGYLLGNDDKRIVSYSCGANVFKSRGNAGLNYIHGGSSPQEMLIPVIDVKMDKGAVETTSVQILLVSLLRKVTNLIITLDFIQSEPVSDIVKATTYKVSFKSDDNETISNENIYVADRRDEDVQKRMFRMSFTFKNRKYDGNRRYYLVIYDMGKMKERFRQEVVMDIMPEHGQF